MSRIKPDDRIEHIRELNEQLASRDAEVAELQRKLDYWIGKGKQGQIAEWRDASKDLNNIRDQVTLLRDAIKDALWDETWWRVKATEALDATETK